MDKRKLPGPLSVLFYCIHVGVEDGQRGVKKLPVFHPLQAKQNHAIWRVFSVYLWLPGIVIHRLASMQKFLSKLELFCLYLHRLSCYSKTLSMLITNYNKLGIHNVGFCYAIHYFMDKLVVCLWAVKRLYVSPNFFLIVEGQRTNYSIYLWAGSWITLK